MAHIFQLIFACTPAQLETALVTTLPAVGFVVTRAPIKATGWIVGSGAGTGAAAGLGQIDFNYDGRNFLTFFGANPAPVAQQPNAGVVENQISTALVTELTTVLASLLGAPVPPNQAVPPPYVP